MRKPPATAQPAPLVSLGCFLSRANWSLQHRMTAGATVAVVVAGVTEVSDVHPAAAEVVQAVAEWVLASPGPADSAVLVGNGEFAVLCGGVRESSETDAIVRRIREAANRRFFLDGVPVSVATAAGIAMASAPGGGAEELVGAASRAMLATRRHSVASPALGSQAAAGHAPSRTPYRVSGASRVVSAGHSISAPGAAAGLEPAEAVVHRLFGLGMLLESAAGLAGGAAAGQVRQAADELEAIIQDIRSATFSARLPPGPAAGDIPGRDRSRPPPRAEATPAAQPGERPAAAVPLPGRPQHTVTVRDAAPG